MSFEEKGNWVIAAIFVALPTIYFLSMLGQLQSTSAADIDYQRALLTNVGATIALTILGMIGIGILSPNDAGKADQRDKEINRLGEYVGGTVLGVGMLVPFGLALAELPHFWIANAMYLAFVIAALVGTAVKLVAYRRGF
jgi:hypothetical protein